VLNCNSDTARFNADRIPEIEASCPYAPSYCVGMIWSGTLWDLRTAIGPVADRIGLEALAYVPSQPTFGAMADALTQADIDHHGGAHLATIQAVLAGRHITPTSPDTPIVSIAGPEQVATGDTASWQAIMCCGKPPYTCTWSKVTFPDGVPHTVFLGTGTAVSMQMGSESFHLVLYVEDASRRAAETSRLVTASSAPPSPPPPPVPPPPPDTMVVTIVGDTVATPGVAAAWTVFVQGGGSTLNRRFSWTRTFLGPGNVPVVVGTRGDLALADNPRNFALAVSVAQDGGSGGAARVVRVTGTSAVTIRGPSRLGRGDQGTFVASAAGGFPPYTYRWTRGCPEPACGIATGSSTLVFGDGRPFDLYVVATSANGAESDQARFHVDSVAVAERLGAFGLLVLENPARSGTLQVAFALGGGAASIEVLDVHGRLVRRDEVGGFGAGAHALAVASDLPRGIYLVRLTQAGRAVTRKVSVLR
jgi:hypothetical protein